METLVRRCMSLGLLALLIGLRPHDASGQSVSVGGLVYSQYQYQLAESADDANAFDVKRAYLDFRGTFDAGIQTRVTADLHRAVDGSLNYRLKYAYFAWTPENSPVTLKFGQIHTPWLDWVEGLWDYRMQGTMPLERNGYSTSSDLGAGVDGAWGEQRVNMQLVVMNGEGYHGAEVDKHKDVGVRGSLRLLSTDDGGSRGGLRVTGLAQLGSTGGGGTRNRFIGMLSYKSSMLTLAGQAGRLTDSPSSAASDVDGSLLGAYGVVKVPDTDFAFIARIDVWDPNVDADDDRQTRFIGGVSYQLSPQIRLLVDLDHVTFEGTAPSVASEAGHSTLLFQSQIVF